MTNPPDAHAPIRSFLINHPGQHCVACLGKGTALVLDASTVKEAFRPSKHNPYSFMPATCGGCGAFTICVAYVGEPNSASQQNSAIAVTSGRS